jgi:hypothetical protein
MKAEAFAGCVIDRDQQLGQTIANPIGLETASEVDYVGVMIRFLAVATLIIACGCSQRPQSRTPPRPRGEADTTSPQGALVFLRSLWPEAMATVRTSFPAVNIDAWKPERGPREVALLLPESASCETVLLDEPDENGVSCFLVTGEEVNEGVRVRRSVECELVPELIIHRGHGREDEEVQGEWRRRTGIAYPASPKGYGLLTHATLSRLAYGGEKVIPVEQCAGEKLNNCGDERLPAGIECRACNSTELVFNADSQVNQLIIWPDCLATCPEPPHLSAFAKMADLDLWRPRLNPASIPIVFREMSDCRQTLASRGTSTAAFP